VQSGVEEPEVEVLNETDGVQKSLLRGEEAEIVGGKGEVLRGWERAAVVSVLQDDGDTAGCIGEDVQDACER
jgi:hypothetical protein